MKRIIALLISAWVLSFQVSPTDAAWVAVEPPDVSSNWKLKGVHFTSSNEGWAVGYDLKNAAMLLIHYLNGVWTSVPTTDYDQLNSVHFTSSNEGWAVGINGSHHYSNGQWTTVTYPWGTNLQGVHFLQKNEGWVVGYAGGAAVNISEAYHYLNGSWLSHQLGWGWAINSVHFTSSEEGWAVGWDSVSNMSLLLHYSAGVWSTVALPQEAWEGLNHVYFISPNDGWAVGWGDGILLHYSDGAWVQVKSEALSPGSELNSVHFISSNEGWAVGWILDNKGLYRGLTLHYFNGVWNSVPVPDPEKNVTLYDVHFTSSNEGWAVGTFYGKDGWKGVLLHYLDESAESISTPLKPMGPTDGVLNANNTFSTGGTLSNLGHDIQYFMDWGDGSDSGWLPVGTVNASKAWTSSGTYRVKAQARCAVDHTIISGWSDVVSITISQSGGLPNLKPYKPADWSDKVVVSNTQGTSTDSVPIYSTDLLCVDWAVINSSDVEIDSLFYVGLYVDGDLRDTWFLNSLDKHFFTSLKDYPIGSLGAGKHAIRIVVDLIDTIRERDEGDNEYVKWIDVLPQDKANLAFCPRWNGENMNIYAKWKGTIKFWPFTDKDNLLIAMCLQNNGGAKAPGKITVTLFVDDVKKKTWNNKKGLGIQEQWWGNNLPIGKLKAGDHEIKLVADHEGSFLEGNEGDNVIQMVINIQGITGEVDKPAFLNGPNSIIAGRSYSYTTGGSICHKGGDVEYQFDWGDGSQAYWLPAGLSSYTHSWQEGNYWISVKARCKDFPGVWSQELGMSIGTLQFPTTGGDGDD